MLGAEPRYLYEVEMTDQPFYAWESYLVLAQSEEDAWAFVIKSNRVYKGIEFSQRAHEIRVHGEGDVISKIH